MLVNRFLFFILLVVNSVSVYSQLGLSIISPQSNQIDWTAAGVEGGIPNYFNEVDVLQNGLIADGVTDNSLVLQSLINNASSGTVFYFPTGTYFFSSSINLKNNVVLRGECSDVTTLEFDLAGVAAPSFSFEGQFIGSEVSINSGYLKGSTSIDVSNSSQFSAGDYIEIMQDNDSSLMYTSSTWNVTWAQETVGQMVQVVSISGNQLTLNEPLLYDFSPVLNVRGRPIEVVEYSGIENLKAYRVDNGNDFNFVFKYAANCWLRNIEGNYCDRGHVTIDQSAHIEVRESYFHHAYDYGGGGHGYGVNLGNHSTLTLTENNIFYFLRHSFLARTGAIGNVFANNYSHTPNGSSNDIAMHGHYGLMNLIEGNIVQKIIVGDYWGPSGPGNTFFRNKIETNDIVINDYSHSQNIIANEIINGSLSINSNTNNTWTHDNYNGSGLIDQVYSTTIPSSLFRSIIPSYFQGYQWPAIGPESSLGQYTIPAKTRWVTGTELVPCLQVGCQPVMSSSDDGNIAQNVLDGDASTRWSAIGDGEYLEFCFGDQIKIDGVNIAFYLGDQRTTTFDVLVSCDGQNWASVLDSVVSSGATDTAEYFNMPIKNASYARIVCHGNSLNLWNSIIEVDWDESFADLIDVQTECNSYEWIDGNTYSSSNDSVSYTYTNTVGCNVELMLDLIISIPTSGVDNQVACGSLLWIDGITYTSSNSTATHTLLNSSGCDSVVNLNLVINTTVASTLLDSDNVTITATNSNADYQWVDCEDGHAILPGEINQSFTANQNGEYAVVVTENSCSDTSVCVLIEAVGIKKSMLNQIRVYPNPVVDKLYLDFGSEVFGSKHISISSLEGRELKLVLTEEQFLVIDLSNLNNGLYLLRMISNNKDESIRIIKQ